MPAHATNHGLDAHGGQSVEVELVIDGDLIVVQLPRELIGAYLVG